MVAQESDEAEVARPEALGGYDIFVSVEMSRSKWVIGIHTPLVDKIALHTVACGDADAVLTLVERLCVRIAVAGSKAPGVIVCYEAGYEGFWLHRRLGALGIRVVVIDPASLLVDRRAKRAKTDRIDARSMVRALMAHARGEPQVLSEVRVPTIEQDDARRGLRERQRLVKERTAHTNRIKGLLKTQGIMDFDPRAANAATRLDAIVTGDGRPLGVCLKREIMRELDRLTVTMKQIAQVEAERDAVVTEGRQHDGAMPERGAVMIATLTRLKGIGPNDASVLVREAFWRDFRNRRELGGWSGLAPSPWASGSVSRDQGITKAGPPMLRAQVLQMTWRWLLWQPDSALARWFRTRTKGTSGRMRRVMAVALARKLLVALWRYATTGMVPQGAVVT
jgi:transposase